QRAVWRRPALVGLGCLRPVPHREGDPVLLLVTIGLVLIAAISLVIGFVTNALAAIYISIVCSALAGVVLIVFSRMTRRQPVTAATAPVPLPEDESTVVITGPPPTAPAEAAPEPEPEREPLAPAVSIIASDAHDDFP